MARMIVTAPDYVKKKYNLKKLKELETLVADAVEIVSLMSPRVLSYPIPTSWESQRNHPHAA